MRNGILAAFHEINSIVWGGKKLRLLSLDDNYDPVSTLQNTNYFLYNITPPNTSLNYANVFANGTYGDRNVNDVRVFGLLGYVGTPTVQAVYPDIVSKNVPLVASFTGVGWLRTSPFYANVINLRASYDDETAAMVDYLINEKLIRRISVFYQNDSFGLAGLSGVQRSLVNYLNIPIRSTSSYTRNTLNVENAFQEIGAGKPAAIICIGTFAPVAKFIKMVKDLAFNSSSNQYGYEKPNEIIFMTLSFVSPSALMERLNSFTPLSNTFGSSYYMDNVIITQVVPSPFNLSIPVVRSYQNARRSYLLTNDPSSYSSFTPSFIELEGYMAGRLVFSIFQKMVGNLTRSNFIATNYFGGNRLGTDIGDSSSTGDSSGGVSLVDGIKVGPYRWCDSVNVMDLQLPYADQIALNVSAVSNTTCAKFNCNQGLKVVYKSSAQIVNSQISFSIIGNSFSWYDYKGGVYCISDPSLVKKPFIFGQSIYSNKDYTEELMLRKGILLAFAIYNDGLSSSDARLELLTQYHSNTDELLSNTREFIQTHNALSLVGYSSDHFSLVDSSGKINIATQAQFSNITLMGTASTINSMKLRNPFTSNIIHAHSSIFEQLATIVEYSMNEMASSRFSIIYSKSNEDSYAAFGLLNQVLKALGLTLDSSACIDGSNSYSYASIDSIFDSLKYNNSNPQVVIFAFPSNVDVVSSLIDAFQNTYLTNPKFGRNLNIFLMNSFFSLNVEYEMNNWLSANYQGFFQVSFVSHLDSVYSSSQLSISKFIQTMKKYYPADYSNSTLYHNKVLEGFYIGNLITSVLINIDSSLNSQTVMDTIYKVKSFISQQTTYGSFDKTSCNVGIRQNYVFTFDSNSFSKVYTKSYDSGCALLSTSVATAIQSYVVTPLLFGYLVPYKTIGNSQIQRQLDLLSQISDMDTSGHTQFSKGLSTYFRYINQKYVDGYSSKNVQLVVEFYSTDNDNFNLPNKVNSLIDRNRVFAIIGSEFIFTSSDVSSQFDSIRSTLETAQIPWINSYGGSMELREPYTPYFVNIGPSVIDQTITFFNYFNQNATFQLALLYEEDEFWTNKAVGEILNFCKTESTPLSFSKGIYNNSIPDQILDLFSNQKVEKDLAIMVLARDSNSALIIKHSIIAAQKLGLNKKIYFGILIENSGDAFEKALLSTSDISNWISLISGSTLSSLSQLITNGVNDGKLLLSSSMASPFQPSSNSYNNFINSFMTESELYFDVNVDQFTFEGYSLGNLIDILITSIQQYKSISGQTSNITSTDLLDTIYSNTVFDLTMKKVGPLGYKCSNTTTTTSTCESSTSLGCSCNEGAKQVVLSTLTSLNSSTPFQYSNTATTNTFGTCGLQAVVPSLSIVAIIMIVLGAVAFLLIITIIPILSYRYYAARKAIMCTWLEISS